MLIYAISLYLFVAVMIIIYLSSYVLSKSRINYAIYFSALCICIAFYLFGYLMELNTENMAGMIFWSHIQYIGIPFYGAFWLVVTLLYTKRLQKIKVWYILLLLIIPLTTFILKLTNGYHLFFYKSIDITMVKGSSYLLLEKGPWYYVQVIYSLAILVMINILYIQEHKNASKNNRFRYKLLIIASFLPYLGLGLIFLTGIDFTALINPISIIIVVYAIFKYDFLDIRATSRESIFVNNPNGMIILDNESTIIEYNTAAAKFFSMQGIKLGYMGIDIALQTNKALSDILHREEKEEYNYLNEYYEIKSIIMKDKKNRDIGKLVSIINITEKKNSEEELKRLATIDSLSELYNRRQFMELGNQQFKLSQRYNNDFCLVMMDLDYFKNVNDKYGHASGDKVIKTFGELIKKSFRSGDISGRLGGEEFSVILLNTKINEGYEIAEKFRKIVEQNVIEAENNSIKITVSIGITSYKKDFKFFNEILGLSDKAMYESKVKGRNCTSIK